MFTSIIVAVDVEGIGERALPVAQSLARLGGLPLEVVTIASPTMSGAYHAWKVDQRVTARGIGPYSVLVLHEDDPAGAIAGHVNHADGALLVMATSARSALGVSTCGSVSENVLAHVHQPVLLVGPNVEQPCPLASPTLVVAVDGSDHAEAALPVIVSWTRTFPGKRPWLTEVIPLLPSATPVAEDVVTAHVRTYTDRLVAHGVHAATEVLRGGDPVTLLNDFADHVDDGVLVVTSERWDGSSHWHSTARKLARWSTRPVLVVPADRPGLERPKVPGRRVPHDETTKP